MRFCNYLLRIDGDREASLDDFKEVIQTGPRIHESENQKFLYSIDMEIVEDRFFWMSCEYDDAKRFRNYVVNRDTGAKEPNPRSKEQIEPRQQFFACYDCRTHFLYLNDMTRRPFFRQYISDVIKKDVRLNNVYASVDEFCERMKTIRGFQYTQVDNFFGRSSDLFTQVGNIWGQDLPSKIQLKISYGDIPVHGGGRQLVDLLTRHKGEFENVIIIGGDDAGVEHTFDFSSLLKHVVLNPHKDENEHFDSMEVRTMLLNELR